MAILMQQLRELIQDVLHELDDEVPYSEEAVDLLLGTAATESMLGTYIRQLNGGPALGIMQMEPSTEEDIWYNWIYYRHDMKVKMQGMFGLHGPDRGRLRWDLRYAIVMARLQYRRAPGALPARGDRVAQAMYWELHYNSTANDVSERAFLRACARLL